MTTQYHRIHGQQLTGYEPNAIVEISRTEVAPIYVPSSRTSFCSAYHSRDDATTAPVSSEVDERQSTGRLASPLLMRKREASEILARIYHCTGDMSSSSHIPSKEKCCDTLTQTDVEQRDKRRTGETLPQVKEYRLNIKKFGITPNYDHKKQFKDNMKPYQDSRKWKVIWENFLRSKRIRYSQKKNLRYCAGAERETDAELQSREKAHRDIEMFV